jgi:excisionase family DNA binding protein
MQNHKLLTTEEAAEYLRFSKRKVDEWRKEKTGPNSIVIGGKVFYHIEDLDAWIESFRETDK